MATRNQTSLIRKIIYSIMMFVIILALFVGFDVPSAQALETATGTLAGVTVSMSADQASFDAGDAVILHVTFTNSTASPVKILNWLTPLNGAQEPLFTVTRDGEVVSYLGKIAKRAAPTESDYIVLEAGASQTGDVDLSAYYDLSSSGNYEIRYEVASSYLYLNEASAQLASNLLYLSIEGRANPVIQQLLPQSVTGTNSFVSCSGSQQTDLIAARNAASTYAANAVSYFSANKLGARYTTWFGIFDAARYSSVSSHFTNILSAVDTATPMTFDCGCPAFPPAEYMLYYAYVYVNSPYNIYLCGAFWPAPTSGTDSKAGTLIHEISHFTVVAGTDDYAYGQSAAQALAISNPANAVQNADSHEYFAENTPVLENDTTAPLVSSSVRSGSNPTGAVIVYFTVVFSEYVTGVDPSDFSFTYSGLTGASVVGVSGSGTTYYVAVNTGSGNGNIKLTLIDNDSIVDWNSNALGGVGAGNGDFTTGQAYTIDRSVSGGSDTTGVFRPSNGVLFMKNANTSGFADIAINYGAPGDYPITGDWDGNGAATIGIYRNGSFFLRNSNTLGFADLVFTFGVAGDQPIAGDWNGDGVDTIGIFRPTTGQFLLRNTNSAGAADASFFLGNVGDVGIAGDWNGDGVDTTGVFRPSNGVLFMKNANTSGFADIAINYGIPGDQPVTGDWDNDGVDTIGVYRNGQFLLRNSNTLGFADILFALGNPGDMPLAGNWDGLP